jgi:hypothetical protein
VKGPALFHTGDHPGRGVNERTHGAAVGRWWAPRETPPPRMTAPGAGLGLEAALDPGTGRWPFRQGKNARRPAPTTPSQPWRGKGGADGGGRRAAEVRNSHFYTYSPTSLGCRLATHMIKCPKIYQKATLDYGGGPCTVFSPNKLGLLRVTLTGLWDLVKFDGMSRDPSGPSLDSTRTLRKEKLLGSRRGLHGWIDLLPMTGRM